MSHFTDASLKFLRGLKRNNARPWFEAHREEYELHVKQPLAEVVEEMDVRMGKFAPEMVGEPKRSIFRIHRDVRFSSDKSPYKTHAAAWFFHSGGTSKVGREAHGGGAGFYLHVEPGKSMVGGGCWMPPRPALSRFRTAILADLKNFERIVAAPALRKRFGSLEDEGSLKRVPRGYDADSPAAPWLKRQSFTIGRSITDKEMLSTRLTATLEKDFAAMLPLVRWLNLALGLPPARSR